MKKTIYKTNKIPPINKRFNSLNERMMKSVVGEQKVGMSCKPGYVYDPSVNNCVPKEFATQVKTPAAASVRDVAQMLASNLQNTGVLGLADPKVREQIELLAISELDKAGIIEEIIREALMAMAPAQDAEEKFADIFKVK